MTCRDDEIDRIFRSTRANVTQLIITHNVICMTVLLVGREMPGTLAHFQSLAIPSHSCTQVPFLPLTLLMRKMPGSRSLVPRPSRYPVFDHLQLQGSDGDCYLMHKGWRVRWVASP